MANLIQRFQGAQGGNNVSAGQIIYSNTYNTDCANIVYDFNAIYTFANSIDTEHPTKTMDVHGIGSTSSVVGTETVQTLRNKTLNLSGQGNSITNISNTHIQTNANIAGSKINLGSINVNDLAGTSALISGTIPELRVVSTSSYTLSVSDVKDTVFVCSGNTSFILPQPSTIPTTLRSANITVMNYSKTQSITVSGFGSDGLNKDSTITSFSIPPGRSATFTSGYHTSSRNVWYETSNMTLQIGKPKYGEVTNYSNAVTPAGLIKTIEQYCLKDVILENSDKNQSLNIYMKVIGKKGSSTVYQSDIILSNNIVTGQRVRLWDFETGSLLFDVTGPLTVDDDNIVTKRQMF